MKKVFKSLFELEEYVVLVEDFNINLLENMNRTSFYFLNKKKESKSKSIPWKEICMPLSSIIFFNEGYLLYFYK